MPHSGKTMTFATDLVPQENDTYNLGTDTLRWKLNGISPGNGRVFYGTCATAAGTPLKEVICASYDKQLTNGDMLIVKFSNTNSGAVGSLQITVKNSTSDAAGTDAKNIKRLYNTTGANNLVAAAELHKDAVNIFVYNGTYWIMINGDYNNTYYYTSIYCTTAAATAAKIGTISSSHLETAGRHFQVFLYYTNTAKSALTLNISGRGARPIYINGEASSASNYALPSGCYIVYDDGENYYFRTDGKLTGDIVGNAATATQWAAAQTAYVDLENASTTTSIQGGSSSAAVLGVNGILGIANGGTGFSRRADHEVLIGAGTNTDLGWRVLNGSDLTTAIQYYTPTDTAPAPTANVVPGTIWLRPTSVSIEDLKCLVVQLNNISGTGSIVNTNANPDGVNGNMVVVGYSISNPSAVVGDLTWNTSNTDPKLVISGVINGTTNIILYMLPERGA